MKKLITAVIVAALGVSLNGCATNKAIDKIDTISADTSLSQMACYEALEAEAQAELAAMKILPPEDVKDYLIMRMMSQNSVTMLAVATGRSADRCGGANVYDFLARATEAEYRMIGQLGGGLFKLATWWAVAHEIGEFGQALAESKGINVENSEGVNFENVDNSLRSGKDATYLSGDNATMDKVDNDIVQNQGVTSSGSNTANEPGPELAEEVEPETEIGIEELEVIE